jgi:hypothetical protein
MSKFEGTVENGPLLASLGDEELIMAAADEIEYLKSLSYL